MSVYKFAADFITIVYLTLFLSLHTGYPKMSKFLNMTGRPILFNCQWPGYLVGVGIQVCLKNIIFTEK